MGKKKSAIQRGIDNWKLGATMIWKDYNASKPTPKTKIATKKNMKKK